jgi:opacity protein-like surface antigen
MMILLVGSAALAQDNITTVTYQPSIAQGDFSDFIKDTSWIGWGLEGRHFTSPTSRLTVGFSFAWHVFDEKWVGTTDFDNGSVTGTQRRWVNSLPFLLTGDFYFNRKNAIKPFIGIGAGAYYIVQRLDIGVWTSEKSNWHFGIAPEAGIQFPLGDIEGIIAARYNYAFAAGESVTGEAAEYQYLTGIIGLAYTRW